MKSWKDITKNQKIFVLFLLIVVLATLSLFVLITQSPDFHQTTITCGNKTIILNGTGHSLRDYCPEAFTRYNIFEDQLDENFKEAIK